MKISEVKETKNNPMFGTVQQMRMCPECLRNIEPGTNVDEIWEVTKNGRIYLLTDPFCPHCGVGITPVINTIH